METRRYKAKWHLIMRFTGRVVASLRVWIILLSTIVVIGGCEREVIIIDDTPAQFIEANNDGRNWEVYFDKQPKDLSVEGAKEYGLSSNKLWITGEGSRRGEIIVSWQGGKKTFTYQPPPPKFEERQFEERSTEPPPAPATTVTVEPPPGATIPSNQEFSLTFDQAVAAATVNGAAVTGSGSHWTAVPALQQGRGQSLNVDWTNLDGSSGSMAVGPYTVRDK